MPRTELEILHEEIARAEYFEDEIGKLRCRRLLGEDVSEAMQLAEQDLHTAVIWAAFYYSRVYRVTFH